MVEMISFSQTNIFYNMCFISILEQIMTSNRQMYISNLSLLVASPLHIQWFPDIVMKNFALRIFYISDANERQNQVPLGCTTIHAIFLLTVRRIRMFFSLKPSPSQGESSLKISGRWGSPFRRSQGTSKHPNTQTHSLTDWCFEREILYCDKNYNNK